MPNLYIQGSDGLIEYGNVTAEKIIGALGYTPADASKIESISDADNTAKYVTDKNGNIITKTDGSGFHAAEVYIGAKTVSTMISEAVAEVDVEESDPTVPAWAKASAKPSYTASEVGAVSTSAFESHTSDDTSHLGNEISKEDDTALSFVDSSNNIIAKIDGDGLDTAVLKVGGEELRAAATADTFGGVKVSLSGTTLTLSVV